MAYVATAGLPAAPMTREEKKVIFASSLGTVFEWYDFYLYGSLSAVIAAQFFSGVNPTAAFIFALMAFAAGFAVRPFGALVFGRLGDMIGRKYTFLVTILIMGLSTFIVGILPNYAAIGIAAPIILIGLRLLQGLALGGEYGGAATYVAEHAPHGRRGAYTSWIQTTATLGLFLSLLVILGCRVSMSAEDFASWGWRIPFMVSIVLLGVSVWIRLMLNESPAFQKMKDEGTTSKAPLKESFGDWKNLKVVLLALFGLVAGQAVVWYTGQFYALFFLTQTLKVDAPGGEPDDRGGAAARHPVLRDLRLALRPHRPQADHHGRAAARLPDLLPAVQGDHPLRQPGSRGGDRREHRSSSPPIPTECSFQFNPVGTSAFTTSCDIAKTALVKRGIPYSNVAAPAGTVATVAVGDTVISSVAAAPAAPATVNVGHAPAPAAAADATAAKSPKEAFEADLATALEAARYPAKADPARTNTPMVVLLLTVLVLYVTMVYAPIAAMLVEMFPTRIRYTSMSLPYHIGNGWFGGFLPTTSFAIVAATGNIYSGLWYPIVIAAATFVIGMLFVRETKDVDIFQHD